MSRTIDAIEILSKMTVPELDQIMEYARARRYEIVMGIERTKDIFIDGSCEIPDKED